MIDCVYQWGWGADALLVSRWEQVGRPGTWQPGQSGNPRGRVRSSVREELRRLAARKKAAGETHAGAVARKALEMAEAGNLEAIRLVIDQIDGKLPTPLEHTGSGGGPIQVMPVDYRVAAAPLLANPEPPALAAGSVGDRASSGADEDPEHGAAVGQDHHGRNGVAGGG